MTINKKKILLDYLYKKKYMGFNYLKQFEIPQINKFNHALPFSLIELNEVVSNCNLCSLSTNRKNILFGKGNENSDILFLGLSPSKYEDECGELLTGNNGDMLINIIKNVLKIDINKVYISNILKCISQKDDKNIEYHIKTCIPYLEQQIKIIKPKIIVVFGDAYKYILNNDKSLEEQRHKIHTYNDSQLIITYHPSHLQRNPSLKKDVLEDLTKVKQIMESIT